MRHGFRLALGVVVIYAVFLLLLGVAAWIDGRGLVAEDHTCYLLLVPMAGVIATIWLIVFAAKRQLRWKFLSRERLTFEQWMARHYPAGDVSPKSTLVVLEMVAKGIGGGVVLGQLLPSDRWNEDFVFRLCGTAIDNGIWSDHPLEHLSDELCEWFAEQTGRPLQFDMPWQTLDDMIRGVSSQLGNSQTPPGNGA